MSKKIGQYKIPFYKGNHLGYEPEYIDVEWRGNYEFEDTLTYEGFGRGRSSVRLYFKGANGDEYEMFMKDFDEIMKSGKIKGGKISGKWTFVKRGRNYGIKMVEVERFIKEELREV